MQIEKSLPAGERGSKYVLQVDGEDKSGRSPQGSVDRNSTWGSMNPLHTGSLPAGERGSKSRRCAACRPAPGRSPQGSVDRNEKPQQTQAEGGKVAPRRGAWIEMTDAPESSCRSRSRSPQGSVDRNDGSVYATGGDTGRSPQGSVDRNDQAG